MKTFLQSVLSWGRRHRRGLQWLLAAIALALTVWMLRSNYKDILRLRRFETWRILVILVVFFSMFFVSQLPFWIIIRSLHGKVVGLWSWIRIMSISRMANHLAPQSGTAYRAVALKRECGLSYRGYIHVFALFGWMMVLIKLFLATCLIFALMPGLTLGGLPAGAVTATIFGLGLAGPPITDKLLRAFAPESGWTARVHGALQGMFRAMVEYGFDAKLVGSVVFLVIVMFGLLVGLNKLLFAGMDVQIGYAELALFLVLYQLSAIVKITPGNIGVRELLFGVVGGAVGITPAQGVMVSALLRAVQYAVVFPLGLAFGGWRLLGAKREAVEKPKNSTKAMKSNNDEVEE